MNILLISPNTLTSPYPVYPLGLDYVAGSVGQEHAVRIADLNLLDLAGLEQLLAEFAPALIGIACRNIDTTDGRDPQFLLDGSRQLIAWLREHTRAIIVCGGSGFTIMPAAILALLGADYGLIGEGERFGLLVAALAEGRDPGEIPGVLRAGQAALTPPPWQGPRQRRFAAESGHHRFYLERGGMLNLQSKRGCAFRCLYCPYPRIEGAAHRLYPPEAVAREALLLRDAGARYLFVTDSAFNSDVSHSLAVAQAMQKAGLGIPWGAFFAPVRLPADYFAVMAEAGCRHVEFGTESLAGSMLKSYRKPFRVEDVLAAHQQARAARLHVAHYLLFGGPGESTATVAETLDRIEQLPRAVFFFFVGIRIYPGTGLHETAVAEGRIDREADLLRPVFYQPEAIALGEIEAMVSERAAGRDNWVVGAGGDAAAGMVSHLHRRGLTGPLWEHLAR